MYKVDILRLPISAPVVKAGSSKQEKVSTPSNTTNPHKDNSSSVKRRLLKRKRRQPTKTARALLSSCVVEYIL
ncbi:hypothetical protein HHI36_004665, partial [Cryptolaemus montrouzieri]